MSTLPTWMYGDPSDVAERREAAAVRLASLVIEEARRRPKPRVKQCLAVKRARIRGLVAEVLRSMEK